MTIQLRDIYLDNHRFWQALGDWIAHPPANWKIVLLGLVVALPSLWIGFVADDYMMLAALDRSRPGSPPWYDLYHFVGYGVPAAELVARGILPWWATPTLQLHLVRPLPSALLTLDHTVFGHNAYGYHLHSLVWFSAFLFLAGRFFDAVFDRSVAAVALLILVVCPYLGMPVGWIASRHLLVTAVPTVAGLLCLVRSQHEPVFRGWAAASFLVALTGGEAGLGALAFWASYEVLGPQKATLRERGLLCLVPVVFGLAYLFVYWRVGGGIRGGGTYVDPLSAPLSTVAASLVRFPILLANALWLVPAELGILQSATLALVGALGALAVALLLRVCWARVPQATRAALRWLLPGSLVATLGVTGGMLGGRELTIASLGFAGLIATVLRYGLPIPENATGSTPERAKWFRSTVMLLGITHIVVGPVGGLSTCQSLRRMVRASERAVREGLAVAGAARRIVFLSSSDPFIWVYGPDVARAERIAGDRCWILLSAAKGTHDIVRTGPDRLTLSVAENTLLSGLFEQLFRSPEAKLTVGDEVKQCGGVTVRVADMAEGRPSRLDLVLDAPLEDADVAFVAWRNGALEGISVAEISRGLSIPWSPGPMWLF